MTSSCFQTCPVMTAVKFKSTPTVRLPVVHALMATLDNSIVTCASKAADALLAPLTPARPRTRPRLCVWRWLTVAVSSLETTRPTRPETRPGLTAGSGEDLLGVLGLSLDIESCHDANFIVTDGTANAVPSVTTKLASWRLSVFSVPLTF